MRQSLIASLAVTAGIMCLGASSEAAPLPNVAGQAAGGAHSVVQKVDYWTRYYRRHGYPPAAAVPVVPAPVVPVSPAIVGVAPTVVVPMRPASCGQYRYWNGMACVDARFSDPYLGPR